jgi:hypothetical protein
MGMRSGGSGGCGLNAQGTEGVYLLGGAIHRISTSGRGRGPGVVVSASLSALEYAEVDAIGPGAMDHVPEMGGVGTGTGGKEAGGVTTGRRADSGAVVLGSPNAFGTWD